MSSKFYPWETIHLDLLKNNTDEWVAKHLGKPLSEVSMMRAIHDITLVQTTYKHLKPKQIDAIKKLICLFPDDNLASKYKVSTSRIARIRNEVTKDCINEPSTIRTMVETDIKNGRSIDYINAKYHHLSKTIIKFWKRGINKKQVTSTPTPEPATVTPHLWTPQHLALLGTLRDKELGDKLGISHGIVAHKRKALGVPTFSKNLNKLLEAYVGTDTDEVIAKQFDVTVSRVSKVRLSMNIPHFKYWNEERDALLGTDTDRNIAVTLGLNTSKVMSRRHKLGIAPANRGSGTPISWTSDMIHDLNELSMANYANKYGVSISSIANKRRDLGIYSDRRSSQVYNWNKADVNLLGSMSDYDVSKLLGISIATVRAKRITLGITPQGKTTRTVKWTDDILKDVMDLSQSVYSVGLRHNLAHTTIWKKRNNIKTKLNPMVAPTNRWTTYEIKLLGTMLDSKLAPKIGRTYKAVATKRKKLDIKPYKK